MTRRERKQREWKEKQAPKLADNRADTTIFTETARGYRAREKWAKRYYDLNGAPENEGDR